MNAPKAGMILCLILFGTCVIDKNYLAAFVAFSHFIWCRRCHIAEQKGSQ